MYLFHPVFNLYTHKKSPKTWLQALAILLSFLIFSFLSGFKALYLYLLYKFTYWPASGAALELGVDQCSSYSIVIPLLLSSLKMRLEIGWYSLFAKIKI